MSDRTLKRQLAAEHTSFSQILENVRHRRAITLLAQDHHGGLEVKLPTGEWVAATPIEGALVVKLFHGSGYNQLVQLFKQQFRVVKPIKPKASRDKSSETFLVGIGLRAD